MRVIKNANLSNNSGDFYLNSSNKEELKEKIRDDFLDKIAFHGKIMVVSAVTLVASTSTAVLALSAVITGLATISIGLISSVFILVVVPVAITFATSVLLQDSLIKKYHDFSKELNFDPSR